MLHDSQQPTDDSKTIEISMEKLANVFTAAFWIFQTLIIDSQQPTDDSKTIDISMEKLANVFTAAFWKFQHINN